MTFIISDVASFAKDGSSARFSEIGFTGMYRWQISIQASIPLRINSARPRLRSEEKSHLFKACVRSDSYCEKAVSVLMSVENLVNIICSFFFFEQLHVRYFLGEHPCQIFPLSMVPVYVHEVVCHLRCFLR